MIKVFRSNQHLYEAKMVYYQPDLFHGKANKNDKYDFDDGHIAITQRALYYSGKKNKNNKLICTPLGKIYSYCDINDTTGKKFQYTIGYDVKYYQKIVKNIERYEDYLSEAKDIIWLKIINKEDISINKYNFEWLIGSKDVELIVSIIKRKPGDRKLKYINDSLKLNLSFDFGSNNGIDRNIVAFIGANGVGKTYLMHRMMLSLTSNISSTRGSFDLQNFNISKVINISFNSFDNQIDSMSFSKKTKTPYKCIDYDYFRIDNVREEIEKNELVKNNCKDDDITESFFNQTAKCMSYNILKKMNIYKKSIINSVFSLLCNEKSFSEYDTIKLTEMLWNEYYAMFNQLSNGHKKVLISIITLIYEIEYNTLVFFDEPEANLYPGLVSIYLKALNKILKDYNSYSFMFTHSPVLIQQLPQICVWKIERYNGVFDVENVSFNPLGENIGRITRELFDTKLHNSLYYDYIVNGIEDFNDLGNEAKSIALSRRRNA